MKINQDIKLDFDDVLLVPQRSVLNSRVLVSVERKFQFYHSPRVWGGVPIMCANMSFSSFKLASELAKHKIITCLHKYHSVDELSSYFSKYNILDYVWISIGYKKSDLSKLVDFKNKTGIQPNICIDVPNGHMDVFVRYCKKVRDNFPDSIIMAGNVTNTSSTQELIIYGGIDIVKVGIGGGSACTTRMITGCGFPQLSTCIDNSYVAHGLQSETKKLGLICSDGGHKNSGDVCKAFCAGSDFVMLGGYFAGSDECEGEWELGGDYSTVLTTDGVKKTKGLFTYYGMSTHHSQNLFEDEKKDYRASEGTKIVIQYKGTINDVVKELLGGIRSCCCYIGASRIKDMAKCSEFCRVTNIHNNNRPVFGL